MEDGSRRCHSRLRGTAAHLRAFLLGRSVPQKLQLTHLLLQLGGLVRRGSGQDARVAEAGAQQREQHEDEEDAPDGRDADGQVLHQEGTAGTGQRG